MIADMSTMRPAAWLERTAIVLADIVEELGPEDREAIFETIDSHPADDWRVLLKDVSWGLPAAFHLFVHPADRLGLVGEVEADRRQDDRADWKLLALVSCSAIATPKTVSGSPRRSNSRRMRQTPTRAPYS